MLGFVKYQILLSTLLLVGCASFEPRPLEPEQTSAQFADRSLTDSSLHAFIATNLQSEVDSGKAAVWGLDELTLAAFYYHPELDVARAQWAMTEAGRITAGERPNPALTASGGRNSTTTNPSPNLFTAGIDLTLETAGKRSYRIAQATQLSEAARLNIAAVAWKVRSGVRSSLISLYGARESERLLAQQQAIHSRNIEILESQYREGAISAFELIQARLAADSARIALHDAGRRSAEALVQLAVAMGVPVSALDAVEFSFADFDDLPAELSVGEARRQALLTRADILGALAEYAASQSSLQLEIAKQYPDIHLGPGYEYDQGDNKWLLGLALTLPINRNQGGIAEAQARRSEAAARFNAVQARVLGEIDLALAGLRAATEKQADANSLLTDLKRQESVAHSMFTMGEISGGDLAALQLQLSVSSLARLDALVQAQRAAGQLEDALQSPLGLSPTVWQNAPRISDSTGEQDRR